jgi:hypothetical protein
VSEVGTEHGHAILLPRQLGGLHGIIEPEDRQALLAHHLEEQATTATDVEHETSLAGIVDGAGDEIDVIAQYEATVELFELSVDGFIGRIPIGLRIILGQLLSGGTRFEADQAARFALDDQEVFGGGVIEAVAGSKQGADGGVAAAGATGF